MLLRISKLQHAVYVLLLAMVVVAVIAYYFQSSGSLMLAMLELVTLVILQYAAFIEAKEDFISPGFLAFYLLLVGLILYGLSLVHRAMKHKFGRVFQEWSAFYLLLFSYILSFQILLPYLWPSESKSTTGAVAMLFIMAVLAIASLVIGVMGSVSNKSVQNREIGLFVVFVVLLSLLIWATSFVSDSQADYGYYGRGPSVSGPLLYVWIFSNTIFIGIILAIIGYGTWQKIPKIINLGILFFAVDIITRYIGFIMDYWGYTSLAIIFISGGLILLAGGYGIEKWRRSLISKAKSGTIPPSSRTPQSTARYTRK
ncbi:hypothetical protein HYT53_01550 [Candidatus Woesearchaeota archaeon]|nr:hypothetical protein [Candidatus Woesearchaeota archaeon]